MTNARTQNRFMYKVKSTQLCLLTILCFILLFSTEVNAQDSSVTRNAHTDSVPVKIQKKVSITVTDIEDGSFIEQANVIVGFKSAQTNSAGQIEFDIDVAPVNVVVTKAGYYTVSTKLKTSQLSLRVRMIRIETNKGATTVSNGLYERAAEHFSGSATVISGAELRKINPLSFIDALGYFDPSIIVTRNNLNGSDPNVRSDVRIRGRYNFPASATIVAYNGTAAGIQLNPSIGDYVADNIVNPDQPTIFLNGTQVALQTVLDLDINLIDQVTVLKDAASAAAFGARGGNGVVLVKTKLPQKGNMRVHYFGQLQLASADLSSYSLMNVSQKLPFEQQAGLYATQPSLYQSRFQKGYNTNWLKLPLRNTIGHKHTLSLDMGDNDISYGLNFSYNNTQGVMKGSSRDAMYFAAYISSHIRNFFFNNHLSFQKTNAINSPYGPLSDYAWQNPYWNPYDTVTGKMTKILEQYPLGGNTVSIYNPAYNGTLSTTNKTDYSRIANHTAFEWILGTGFKLNGLVNINKQFDENNYFLPPGHTLYADYSANDFLKRGLYNQTKSNFLNIEGRVALNYNKKIGVHQLYASVGAGALQTKSEATGISLIGFTSDRLSDIAFGSAYLNTRPATGQIITRLASAFANITYSYDNRYQFELTGNADASSQFGKNYNYDPHWAGAFSWNLHQEHFFHPNKIVDQFRVFASVGTTGNLFYQSYLAHTSYNYYTDRQYIIGGSNAGTRGIGLGAYITGFSNDDLRAPVTIKMNTGFDAVLFQNRLSVRAEAFKQNTDYLVLPLQSPASTGFLNYSYYDNLAALETKGVEFAVNYLLLRNKKKTVLWNVMLNGIHSRDKIKSTSEYIDAVNKMNDEMTVDQTIPQPRYVAGQSLTGIWAVRSLGIDPATGQEKFLKADGSTTFSWNAADKIFAGDINPDWIGSFGTAITVKSFSAGIYFNYQFGAEAYNQTHADKIENASLLYNVDERAGRNRWKQAGDQAFFKAVSLDGMVSSPTYATTRFVEKNDFINCSAVSLGYGLPQNFTNKIKAQQVNLRLIAENMFRSGGLNAERGIYYPFQRRYSLTVNASF
jgi:TonB-linked SusC/RagA family outer membrane protein